MLIHTRFAPSPTGRLHLGHAFSAIQAHDFARAQAGRFSLRIEDIDGTRSRPEHVEAILRDLEWLGLAWDGEVTFQSQRLYLYEAAFDRLRAMGLLYPCFCTRADIAASLSAPHSPEGALYPGTCRDLGAPDLTRPHSWRLDVVKALQFLPELARGGGPSRSDGGGAAVADGGVTPPFHHRPAAEGLPPRDELGEELSPHDPSAILPLPSGEGRGPPPTGGGKGEGSVSPMPALTLPPTASAPSFSHGERDLYWHDAFAGWIRADPASHGDVILARKDAPASYHLAVTVDDAAQGITHVIRGKDLFEATHVHRLLQALLDLPTPEYRHHDLLTGPDGTRLAKRHNAPTLEAMRLAGADGRALADRLRAGLLPVGFAAAPA